MTKEPCGKKQWLICNVSRINYNSFSIRKSSTRYIIYKTPKWVNRKKTAPRSGFSRLFLVGTKASKVKTGACYICLVAEGLEVVMWQWGVPSTFRWPHRWRVAPELTWVQWQGLAHGTGQQYVCMCVVFSRSSQCRGPWTALCHLLQVGLGDGVPLGVQ